MNALRSGVLTLLGAGAALAACGGGNDDPPASPEAALFQQRCGSCHALDAAGTGATVGPDLDALAPSADRVEQAIRTGPGIMPSFEGNLSEDEIATIASYVADSAGG